MRFFLNCFIIKRFAWEYRYVGGFCGRNTSHASGATAQIENCYCRASVGGANYVGGFIAQNGTYFGGAASMITDCYCVSPVTSLGTESYFCDYSFSRKVEKEYVYERSAVDGELRLWPNPANDRIYFKYSAVAGEPIRYEIISAIGGERIVSSELGSGSAWEDISEFPTGVYFLRVFAQDKVKIVKFVKAD